MTTTTFLTEMQAERVACPETEDYFAGDAVEPQTVVCPACNGIGFTDDPRFPALFRSCNCDCHYRGKWKGPCVGCKRENDGE